MNSLRLKKIRENREINQKTLAKILKVSQPAYARWESLERVIPLARLRDLCNYFEVSMDYVFNLSLNNNYQYINTLDKVTIGNNIYKFRKERNITQNELAKFLNTTHSTISAYEHGKTMILTVFLYQICKKYNVSMDDFVKKS